MTADQLVIVHQIVALHSALPGLPAERRGHVVGRLQQIAADMEPAVGFELMELILTWGPAGNA